ncbi:S-adenosyl-L-methionine-dependent methyltransferase [Diplogelasinospora grovesii]|uniref:S-adenosyl-L-methionine-dependent methyltransferase n=1 Tax=Diplogelasinospora grovesii TaxID=303347 RepID=A0AAN6S3S9_9PEZI|nr:S-adenosyl-L-methionine-dependent methyltransferase [Diplogelasinospora grovesii]
MEQLNSDSAISAALDRPNHPGNPSLRANNDTLSPTRTPVNDASPVHEAAPGLPPRDPKEAREDEAGQHPPPSSRDMAPQAGDQAERLDSRSNPANPMSVSNLVTGYHESPRGMHASQTSAADTPPEPESDASTLDHGGEGYLGGNGQEELEAAEQAEEGSIVIDSDDLGTDAGYETDNQTGASTSLAESVRDYIFENGRRYHKFREGRYNFPNDDVEQQREDMKHAMIKMLCGQLHFAPIGSHPQEVLDIGTGTGIWAIEMGDQFESANILGIDLSPIQPEWVPPNVRFMVDDVESLWLHPRNHFDYIHARHTVMAIKDWPRLMMRALEHLRPGGWLEIQEVHHFPISLNGTMPPDHPVAQYWGLIREGLANLGIDFHAVARGRLADTMRESGYVNVTERVLQIPLGTWPKNKVLKTVGLYWRTILLDGIQAIALGPLMRGCKWSREEVELFLVQVRRAYHDNSCLLYMPLHISYGQKPQKRY